MIKKIMLPLIIGVAVLFLIMFSLYFLDIYAPLTVFFDSVFKKNAPQQIEKKWEPSVITGLPLAGTIPVFSGEVFPAASETATAQKTGTNDAGKEFSGEYPAYIFSLSDDRRTVSCFSGEPGRSEALWTYEGKAPVIAGPMLYPDCAVFIDAFPAVVGINLISGQIFFSAESPVFPDIIWEKQDSSFIFKGRNGKLYRFSFIGQDKPVPERGSDPFDSARNNPLNGADTYFSEILQPPPEVWERMLLYINSWLPSEIQDSGKVTAAFNTLADFPAALSETAAVSVFLCYPDEPDTYLIGIGDSEGRPVKVNSFVAVFSEQGDFLTGSVDYVGNVPQVSISLTAGVLYYFAMGVTGTEKPAGGYYAFFREAPS